MNHLIEQELALLISPYTDWSRRKEKDYTEDAKLALQAFYHKQEYS
ncbi:MAG: hypothetical protein GXY49_03545 [Syntrophomonadaceae bacterium]|nr:hypothetical protein [Syntrophomonadaceae bacterium]